MINCVVHSTSTHGWIHISHSIIKIYDSTTPKQYGLFLYSAALTVVQAARQITDLDECVCPNTAPSQGLVMVDTPRNLRRIHHKWIEKVL